MPVDREAVLRAAERLLRQGRLDGAIAEYVRLTDDQPRDWNSINTLGDLYVRAGNHERAVAQFVRIADHLFDEGFLPKAAALYKKALKVKHDHEHTLLRLSDIAVQQGLLADAKLYLRQLGRQRQTRGDEKGAAACVLRLGEIDEGDSDAKIAAARAAEAMGDIPRAVMFLQEAAAAFDKQKRPSEAVDALVAATRLAPEDAALRATVARVLLTSGQIERAQPFLNPATVGEDPDLLVAVARHDLTAGRTADAYAGLMRAVALAPDRREQVARLADELLSADQVETAYGCTEVLVDAALFESAFDRAAQLLESFLERRRLVSGLLKLVDVYLDAGLDDRITVVQGQLADAYLESGQAAEARVVAEDLVAREPHVEAHVQRLRRALTALGVDDVEGAVATQLEATPMFDQLLDFSSFDAPPMVKDVPAAAPDPPEPTVPTMDRPSPVEDAPRRDTGEIDLSAILADLKAGVRAETRPALESPADVDTDPAALLERAQEHLRRGAAREAIAALETAARVPQLRFKAAAQLGRMAMSHGDVQAGIEWLEQAASARSASPEETFAINYDLADALERAGERVRALAVFMELEEDAGAFRDVRTRIDQLTAGAMGVNGDRT